MADGDITTITEYGRFAIPGAGHNLQGMAKNNKVLVWGRLVGTYDTLGLALIDRGGLRALGVSVADFWSFTVRYCGSTATTVPTDLKLFLADLELLTTPGRIFVADEVGQDPPAEPSDAESVTIDFLVIGEDATAPELV
jgi:hypothetical protein